MSPRRRRARALWSALRYPALPLERLGPASPEPPPPRAVTTMDGSRRVVLQAERRALELGVVPGLALSGAQALAPDFVVLRMIRPRSAPGSRSSRSARIATARAS